MPKGFGQRTPVDIRIVEEIESNPHLRAEQGTNFMGNWGGSQEYKYWARQPAPERAVFFAVQEGHTTLDALSLVTGLDSKEVSRAVNSLVAKKKINVLAVGE